MNDLTYRALLRHAARSSASDAAAARGAIQAAGLDPYGDPGPDPVGYNATACDIARAVNPAYLTTAELSASIAAREAALGGHPF
jgi:hypothetical protein